MTGIGQSGVITTPPLSQADIQSLQQLYTFRKPTAIVKFLEKYPFLVAILQSVPDKTIDYFPNSQLFLEYVTDPEIDDEQLVVYIATDLDPDEAVDRLWQLGDNWWLNALEKAQGQLGIDVEFS
ncbi:MAG: hypothetical protein AB4426_34870 [Xenococcaceae cyanobacterium]